MINFRNAKIEDEELLFKWVNEKQVRKNSFNTKEVTLEEHKRWFRSVLADSSNTIYIIIDDNNEVGQVRLQKQGEAMLISYSVDSEYRGKGIGTKALSWLKNKYSNQILIGRVKPENMASIYAFQNAGYIKYEINECIEFRSK